MAIQYKVKKGDTLSGIAQKYGVNLNDISGYRSGNKDLIYPDELLTIGKKVKASDVDSYNGGKIDNLSADMNMDYNLYTAPDTVYDLSNDINTISEKQAEYLKTKNEMDKVIGIKNNLSTAIETSDEYKRLNELKQQLAFAKGERDIIRFQNEEDAVGRGITTSALNPYTASDLRKNTIKSYGLAQQVAGLTNYIELERDLAEKKFDAYIAPLESKLRNIEYEIDVLEKNYKKRKGLLSDIIKNKLEERKLEVKKNIAYINKQKAESVAGINRKKAVDVANIKKRDKFDLFSLDNTSSVVKNLQTLNNNTQTMNNNQNIADELKNNILNFEI
jgi:murein DD-endopeptidase MepM/ murein hydrolase activator NlpD